MPTTKTTCLNAKIWSPSVGRTGGPFSPKPPTESGLEDYAKYFTTQDF
jgi:hypothetical protein